MSQNRQFLIVILLFLFFAGVLNWILWGNRGELSIQAEAPFTFSVKGYRWFECPDTTPCTQKIPFGKKEICIEKSGFVSACETLSIPWRKSITWNPILTMIPRITDTEPKNTIQKNDFLEEKKQYEYDNDSGELFSSSPKNKRTIISQFHGIKNPTIYYMGENILLKTKDELFLIDTLKKRKRRIYMGSNFYVRVYTSDFTLLSKDKLLYQISEDGVSDDPLPFYAPLQHITKCEDAPQIYLTLLSKNTWSFYEYNIMNKRKKPLITAKKSENNFELGCGEKKKSIRVIYSDGKQQTIEF